MGRRSAWEKPPRQERARSCGRVQTALPGGLAEGTMAGPNTGNVTGLSLCLRKNHSSKSII